jgi:predicted SAM-dependent methyltransferase
VRLFARPISSIFTFVRRRMGVMEPWMRRKRDRAFANVDISGMRGVEVGPLSRPLILKSESEVYYLDHCSADELRKKYFGDPLVKAEDIVEVDFISHGSPLVELLGDKAPVDYILASHVIEHVPDLIGWLTEMRGALREGGYLALIVPDKRFTFDVYRRPSAYEEITAAYIEKRQRPGLRCIMDHFANVVKADTWKLWEDYDLVENLEFHHGPEFLKLAAEHYEEGRYIDVHCWVFTPWYFLQLMGKIVASTGLGFDLDHFQVTPSHDLEFYVRLKRVGSSTTNWEREAINAKQSALWPKKSGPAVQMAL